MFFVFRAVPEVALFFSRAVYGHWDSLIWLFHCRDRRPFVLLVGASEASICHHLSLDNRWWMALVCSDGYVDIPLTLDSAPHHSNSGNTIRDPLS